MIFALRAWENLSFGILAPNEPLLYIGAYFGGIIDWNYAREEEKWGNTMKNDYLIGYLTKEYVRNICYLYLVVFTINLGIALVTSRSLGLFELFFTNEPLIYIGFYLGTVTTWNSAKEEEKRGNNSRRSVVYFKSIGFLYLTIVVINLVSALYSGTGIDFEVLVVNNDHKFYTASIFCAFFEIYEAWERKVK